MSFTPSEGMLVKISSEVIPETAKDDELLGDLGLPGLLRHAIFEIKRLDKDSTRGDIAYCIITNPEVFKTAIPGVKEVKYEGELVLLIKDIVPANTRVTLDYTIQSGKSKDDVIKGLFAERDILKGRGLKKDHPSMRANWKQIQIARGELKGSIPEMAQQVNVTLTKQRMTFKVDAKDLPTDDEDSIKKFKQLLSNKLRSVRAQRRTQKLESKSVFGIMTVQKSAGVYLQPNSLLKAYEEMMKTTLETDKKPTDAKATYVGIEIEMIYSGKYEVLKRELIAAKLHRNVCLKDDGSLRACHNAHYATKELTLLCKVSEVEDVLKRLDGVLSHPEIDAYANRSCGLHVHLDVRNRKAALVYMNLVRIQNILRGSQPVGRINNTHCRANTSDNLASQQEGGGGNRYWVVNGQSVSRHNSIEVRIHEGTTDCESIYNWVTFLNAIAEHKSEIPKNELKFAEDLVGRFDIDIPLEAIDYIDRRISRFKSLTTTAS
jgi:hypothetical protein